jgi:hypothetical protein
MLLMLIIICYLNTINDLSIIIIDELLPMYHYLFIMIIIIIFTCPHLSIYLFISLYVVSGNLSSIKALSGYRWKDDWKVVVDTKLTDSDG